MSRSAVAPAAGIESLPLDVLAEVLAHAPVAARIKTVSLVCKRWRTAALRSVRFFKLKSTGTSSFPAARVPDTFSLFPSLSDLSLATCEPNWTLPASLLRLSLGRDQLQAAAAAEERGEPTFLSARFPHLSALSLHLPLFHKPSLVPLIAAHSSQLTFLSLRSLTRPLAAIVCTLPWPKLHTLQLTFPSAKKTGIVLSAMPSLRELRLRLANPLSDFADESLTALKHLTLPSCELADLTRLQRLCPDCVLSVAFPRPCEDVALESRFLASVMLESHEWQWLSQFRTVESLIITRPLPAPAPVSLPHLRRVAVQGLPVTEALAAALSVLRMHRSVRTLAVELLQESYAFGDAEQTLLDGLTATAVSLAVRKIVLYIPDPPGGYPEPPAVCRDGWLRLRRVLFCRVLY